MGEALAVHMVRRMTEAYCLMMMMIGNLGASQEQEQEGGGDVEME